MGGVTLQDRELVVERSPNELDELAIAFSTVLSRLDVDHAFIAGYLAILTGRARATDDIDVLIERLSEEEVDRLVEELDAEDYWGPVMSLDGMYGTLSSGTNISVAPDGQMPPHLEVCFPRTSSTVPRCRTPSTPTSPVRRFPSAPSNSRSPTNSTSGVKRTSKTPPTSTRCSGKALGPTVSNAGSNDSGSPTSMSDSDPSDRLAAKHERNRRERLAGIKRWAEYVRDQPPEVWGPQQNRLVNTQLESAREADLSPEHERRVRAFAEAAPDGDSES